MLANIWEVFLAITQPQNVPDQKFLGHVISSKGISTGPAKISAVNDCPKLVNMSQLRSFLGQTSYYRCFVKNFTTIASPSHELMTKNKPLDHPARALAQIIRD